MLVGADILVVILENGIALPVLYQTELFIILPSHMLLFCINSFAIDLAMAWLCPKIRYYSSALEGQNRAQPIIIIVMNIY